LARLLEAGGGTDIRTTHWNALMFPAIWAKRKVFRTARSTSDVRPYPQAIEWIGRSLMEIEHAWVSTGGSWAWGTSLFAVARKPRQR
jgi:hypothetical protein